MKQIMDAGINGCVSRLLKLTSIFILFVGLPEMVIFILGPRLWVTSIKQQLNIFYVFRKSVCLSCLWMFINIVCGSKQRNLSSFVLKFGSCLSQSVSYVSINPVLIKEVVALHSSLFKDLFTRRLFTYSVPKVYHQINENNCTYCMESLSIYIKLFYFIHLVCIESVAIPIVQSLS